jgi:hypothetical protein
MASVRDAAPGRREPRRNPSRPAGIRRAQAAATGAQRPGRAPQRLRPGPVAAAPRRGGATRHYAKHVSALLRPEADTRLSRRHVRSAQREVLWRESRIERVRKCGRVPLGDDIAVKSNGGVCHYAGLTTCGSIWACPVCSAKIRNTRADEISAGAAGWDQAGNSVYMVTLTMPHDFGMKLARLMPVIADGFRSVISGRAWLRIREQIHVSGTIRSVEVTYGLNGWHPHLHVLVFIEGDPGSEGLAALYSHVAGKWRRFITKAGYRPPDDQHGVVIERCTSAAQAGAYIAKTQDGRAVGNELARADLKQGRAGHRTPFELLESFRWTGDIEDLAAWHEYEAATKGHQCITWSKGLRQLLAAPEKSDEEIAAEEIGGDIVTMIPAETWRAVCAVPGLPAAILDGAERGGKAAVDVLLARYVLGIDWWHG